MFTGIIQEVGTVISLTQLHHKTDTDEIAYADSNVNSDMRIEIACNMSTNAKHGSSIAVDGVCLTVVEKKKNGFVADISSDTLSVTNLNMLTNGQKVNLEQGMFASARFDGHIVTGHVDGIGKITSIANQKIGSRKIFISIPTSLMDNIVLKGSVALNGVSLTIMSIDKNIVGITLIPTTLQETTLGSLEAGDTMNIECDYLGKYVLSYMKSLHGERDCCDTKA